MTLKLKRFMILIAGVLACLAIFTGCTSNVKFTDEMKLSEGVIYVDNQHLSITINIGRESTDYWELKISSGADVFTLLEDNPPGKVAQYGHSWIFEAVKSGKAVMEFTIYDENNKPKGNGYRFTFNVDEDLRITTDADYEDLSVMGGNIDYDVLAQEIIDKIAESFGIEKGTSRRMDGDNYTNLLIEGNEVTVYGIAYKFDIGNFIAIDPVTGNIYYSPNANPETFYELFINDDGSCEMGDQVTVEPKAYG